MSDKELTQQVSLTPAAAEAVRKLLQERKLEENYALRVFISGQGCSGFQYGIGLESTPNDTDSIFTSENLRIIVDQMSIQYMSGSKIDFIDDERGRGFLVNNPNTAPSCSCESGSCGTGDH